MGKQYQIDLENYSLGKFKENIESREMIPSRMILKNEIDRPFAALEKASITNLKELIDRLKTKDKIEQFSKETGLSVEYLTILKREAKSYLPSPVRLNKFPGVDAQHIGRLETEGIKNSRHLFDRAAGKEERFQLARKSGVPLKELDELICLSDLARAYGVGPVFARMLYDVDIKTIEEFIGHTAGEIIRIYEEKEGKKADFGENEIQFSLELAKELDVAVEL